MFSQRHGMRVSAVRSGKFRVAVLNVLSEKFRLRRCINFALCNIDKRSIRSTRERVVNESVIIIRARGIIVPVERGNFCDASGNGIVSGGWEFSLPGEAKAARFPRARDTGKIEGSRLKYPDTCLRQLQANLAVNDTYPHTVRRPSGAWPRPGLVIRTNPGSLID